MLRMLARTAISLGANALGLLAAAALVPGFRISVLPFVVAVVLFTVVEVLATPLLTQMSERNVPALSGGVALVATWLGLFVTSLLSSGIAINGLRAWVLSTLIVWLFALIANVVLPLLIFKRVVQERRDSN